MLNVSGTSSSKAVSNNTKAKSSSTKKTSSKSTSSVSKDSKVTVDIKKGKVVNKDGTITKTTVDEKTGAYKVITYDKNGKKTQSKTVKQDGSTATTKYNKKGEKTSTTVVKQDGTTSKTKYDTKNGNKKSTTTVDANGGKSVTSYNSEGKKLKTTKKGADGSKTVISYKNNVKSKAVKTSKNGDVTTIKYNSDGQRVTKQVKNADTGLIDTTKYSYKNDKISSSKTTTVNAQGKEIRYTDTKYDADGKKSQAVTTNTQGEEIAKTTYKYNSKGELTSSQKTKPDGYVKDTTYDTTTGNRKSSVEKLANGKIINAEYNINTNKKTFQKIENTNKNGEVTRTRTYTYDKDGKVSTRMYFDKNGELVNVSKYTRDADGTMTRTDYSGDGNYVGGMTFKYDSEGKNTQKIGFDAEGKVKTTTNYTYYDSGVRATKEKLNGQNQPLEEKRYATNGVLISHNKYKYDKDGNLIGKSSVEYDKNHNVISENKTGVFADGEKTDKTESKKEQETLSYEQGLTALSKAGNYTTDLLGSLETLIQDAYTQATREFEGDEAAISKAQSKYDEAIKSFQNLFTEIQDKRTNSGKKLDSSTIDSLNDAVKDALKTSHDMYNMIEKPIVDAANEILNNPHAAADLKEDAQRALNELKKYKEDLPDISSASSNTNNSDATNGNKTDGSNNGNGTNGVNGNGSQTGKVKKSSEYTRDTQGRVIKEVISGSDGSKAVENYTFDMKTNRLNIKTSVSDDGTYNRASFTYNKDGSVKSIAKTTVAADGTIKTITTTYDIRGNVTDTKESECPSDMQRYQVLKDAKDKKAQIA